MLQTDDRVGLCVVWPQELGTYLPQRDSYMRPVMQSRAVRAAFVLALPVMFAACKADSPTEPGNVARGPIEITSSSNNVFVGDTFSVHATVRAAANGHELPGAPVMFASSDTSVARISDDGQVVTLR